MKQCELKGLKEFNKNVIYPFYEDEGICNGVCTAMDYDLNSLIKGEYKKIKEVYTLGKLKFEKFIFVGLGKKEDINVTRLCECFKEVTKHINEEAILVCHHAESTDFKESDIAYLFTQTYLTSAYKECKINEDKNEAKEVEIFAHEDVKEEIIKASKIANGINFARRLADTPSNFMTSLDMLDEAKDLADRYNLEIEVLDNDALEEMGAGAILAVNQGSEYPAYIVNIKYRKGSNELISLIGKGITFDTGGYNLKSNSLGMKYDMSGAADVLGAMEIIASLNLEVNVDGIICLTDNMLAHNSIKPGDVVTSLSGKTIEITNTDAEGRLILCDGITYAQRNGAKYLVDIATLTGACLVALGNTYTGVFTNDEDYYKVVEKAMKEADEKGWRLPLDDDFLKYLDSNSADIKNSSGKRLAGSSTAACFLNAFVEKGVKWVHLDIAGTAGEDAATGAMIKSLVEIVKAI